MAKTSVRPVYQKVDKWKREGKEERGSGGLYNVLRSSGYSPEIRKREGMNLQVTLYDQLSPGGSPDVFASFVFPSEHGKLTENVKNRPKVHYQK